MFLPNQEIILQSFSVLLFPGHRVYLDCLKQTDEAVRVVMDSQSIEGAKMVAKYVLHIPSCI